MEINEDHWNEKRVCAFIAKKGVSHHELHLAETQRQSGQWESFIVNKRQSFRCALIESCCNGEAVRGLNRSRVSYVTGEHIWLPLGLELETEAKVGNLVWLLGLLLQTWVRVILPYMIWPLSVSIFSLSVIPTGACLCNR